MAVLRSRARPGVLRHRQRGPVQSRAAAGRQQVGVERAGPAAERRRARVGLSVHAARELGIRGERRDDSRRPHHRRPETPRPRPLRQERLRLYDRPRQRGGAGGRAVHGGHVGDAGRSRDRSPGGRFHEAHWRVAGEHPAHLPQPGRRKSPASPASYSPRTGLFYVSTNNLCMNYQAGRPAHIRGTPYIGASTPYTPGPGGYLGAFIAWDAARGRKVWEIREKYPVWSGSLVTAGDVVFYGTLDGWVKVADIRRGKVLWKLKVGSGVVGCPMTYTGPDGKQDVAVYAGIGGDWFLLSGDVRSDDPADVRPPADFAPDLARHTSQGGIVWVFGR